MSLSQVISSQREFDVITNTLLHSHQQNIIILFSEYFSEDKSEKNAFWTFAESLTPELFAATETDEVRKQQNENQIVQSFELCVQRQYESFLSIIRTHQLLSESRLKHLEMGLALHVYSPKVLCSISSIFITNTHSRSSIFLLRSMDLTD